MKRIKMLFAVALICAMGTVGYNAYTDANMTAQERSLLENVEALTSGTESGDGKCTGPKKKGICKCTNAYACSDDHGCTS